MSRERYLLESALSCIPWHHEFLRNEIRDFLSTTEPTQDDEPVDISDKSEPTVAAILPNGVRVTNVYEAYEAGLKAGTEPDDEAWEKGFRQGIKFAKARYGITGGESND